VATYLIVDDDVALAASLDRRYRRFGSVVQVHCVADAERGIQCHAFSGIVLDVALPDGSGLDWLGDVIARRAARDTPGRTRASTVLVYTGLTERAVHTRALALGADCIHKPAAGAAHHRFACRVIASEYLAMPAARRVAELAVRLDLGPGATRILALETARVPRCDWPDILGATQSSIRTRVRRIVQAASVPDLDALTGRITRATMSGVVRAPHTPPLHRLRRALTH
jgi:CheY-like chemotaxis protein